MNRVKKSLYLLCALVIEGTVIGILACSSGPKTVELIKTTEVHKIVEVAVDPGKLVIYSGRKESLIGPVIQQFEESSGIEVEVKYGSSAPLAALLMEEGDFPTEYLVTS